MFLRTVYSNQRIAQVAVVRLLGPPSTQRFKSTEKTVVQSTGDKTSVPSLEESKKEILALLAKELPKPYDGPERDLVNFPRRVRPEEPGKVRLGFVPEEWFQFFYKKTGVTGPYLFGAGLVTFLLSKELYVIEEEFSTGVALFCMVYFAIKKFGPATRKYVDKLFEEDVMHNVKQKEGCIKSLEDMIEQQKKDVWYAEGQRILMEAKRENIQMQLETEYRRRFMQVYEQIKKRLDFQLEIYNTRRKLEQKHMVDWIVNNVIKSITPQQEKEALQKCIEDLKFLSAQAH